MGFFSQDYLNYNITVISVYSSVKWTCYFVLYVTVDMFVLVDILYKTPVYISCLNIPVLTGNVTLQIMMMLPRALTPALTRHSALRSISTTQHLLQTHYETLGVSRAAASKQIKAAYFDLAKKCHPDVNPSRESKERFQAISKAYHVLSNDELRAEYNCSLDDEEIVFKSDCYRNESAESTFRSAFGVNFDEMFSSRFGYSVEEDNLREYILGISLMEAVLGSAKYIEINTHQRCMKCMGYGGPEGAASLKMPCERCYGSGQIPVDVPDTSWLGAAAPRPCAEFITCGDCIGRGYRVTKPCKSCGGKGRTNVIEWHPVTVPPGVKEGQTLNCPGIDGAPMLITIRILPHPEIKFEYNDNDEVLSTIQVHYSTFIQGGFVSVYTIDSSEHTLFIPPGTQPGTLIELEDHTPAHVYKVNLVLLNHSNLTSVLERTYQNLLEEEERHIITTSDIPYTENYSKTVRQNSLSRFQIFKNDFYNFGIVPICRLFIHWPFSGLYNWAKKRKYLGDAIKSIEGAKGHTSHFPENRKNVW